MLKKSNFLKIGHRGAKGHILENTLESFRKAIELGVNAVEFDVRQSRDKKLVVFHDDSLKRIFKRKDLVKDLNLKELKEISGGKIPTLDEVLDFIGKKVKKILIELKEAGYEKKVLKAIKSKNLNSKIIIVSFCEEALRKVRRLDKKVETGLIYSRHPNPIKSALALGVNYILPLCRFTHTTNVKKAREADLGVIVWTINTKREAKKYIKKGADGIVSDRPEILEGL